MLKCLSKSRFIAGLHCPRKLWLQTWQPELKAQPNGMTKLIMEQGVEFGELAHQLFPGAALIDIDRLNLEQAELDTLAAIDSGADMILEAAFRAGQYRAVSDVIQCQADGSWHLTEVKSSTRVKKVHYMDLAFQRLVIEQAGYRVSRCSVLHANTSGHGPDLNSLFTLVDVTPEVDNQISTLEQKLTQLGPLLEEGVDIPEMRYGKTCVGCDYQDYCWSGIDKPTIYDVIDIRKIPLLEQMNIFYVDDISADFQLSGPERKMVDRMQQQRIDIDEAHIQMLTDELRYPLYFLDFESVATAVPLFSDSSPWQKYAFQYSLHVQQANGELRHIEFLHDQRSDPGAAIASSLLAHIGATGSVIVYNKTMERGVLRTLAAQFPDMSDDLRQVASRIWDLEIIFKKFYRHWQWGTKSSIKNVLPTLVPELSYADLDVQDGGSASWQWLRMTETGDSHEKAKMARELKRYCELDTYAMVKLLDIITSRNSR